VPGEGLLTVRGITRRYGDVEALTPTDLDVAHGERIALIGPNGSGKTTLLSILAGVGQPSGGAIDWAGGAALPVGWVPQQPALYPRLTVRENLRLFAGLEGAADATATADALIARADLGEFATRRAAALSTGTMQRLNLAIALAGQPALLLLDEPTGTLSPDQRTRLWLWLDDLMGDGEMALIFSTQFMDEATRHADRMVALGGGEEFMRLAKDDT
jgi:ABC-type multidrug transport system ATPase subunit